MGEGHARRSGGSRSIDAARGPVTVALAMVIAAVVGAIPPTLVAAIAWRATVAARRENAQLAEGHQRELGAIHVLVNSRLAAVITALEATQRALVAADATIVALRQEIAKSLPPQGGGA